MCGICGIIDENLDQDVRSAKVGRMNAAITHRGPDEDGVYSDNYCSLAMRRLSIIDLSTGKQPIYANDQSSLIFFNGEIYNYVDLKADLIAKGFVFDTTSDTEVIINLYQCYGLAMLAMLRGMFAFCIYDIKKHKYIFARDRFGEKPFFYYHEDGKFVFSSELNSLMISGEVPKKLSHSLLGVYLQRSFVPEPFTLFEGVRTLPPGYYMVFHKGQVEIAPYFNVVYKADSTIKTVQEAGEFVRPFLENAVKRQMVSDVPIGAFLSGGIDSSTVVALMQRFSENKVKTFNVKFQTTGYDESRIAKKVAAKIGTEHHEILVENNSFTEEQFWKILRHAGTPFPDSSAIPTDLVTGAIVKHVKVALSGDGGDELFGGYTVFDWFSSVSKLKKIPSVLTMSTVAAVEFINNCGIGGNKLRRAAKALRVAELKPLDILREMHAMFDRFETAALYSQPSSFTDATIPLEFNNLSDLRKAMFYRVKYDLPLDMLIKVDRMSMSNSLEVRNPFLDPDLFDASCALPDKFLRKNGTGKLVIREIMKDELPKEVFDHPKTGFSIPLHDFKNESFKKLARNLVLEQPYMDQLFNREALIRIVSSGLNDMEDSNTGTIYRKTHQLWSVMMLSGWIKMYDVQV